MVKNTILERFDFDLEDELLVPLKSMDVIIEAISTLNEDQLEAFFRIMNFLEAEVQDNENIYLSLEGYAGTGKTYLIKKIASCIRGTVALTAPTNKAVKVLANMGAKDENTEYATIHKLLALRVKWTKPRKGSNEEPKQILVRNYKVQPTVNDYDLLVIDESSMLDDDLFIMLDRERQGNLKVIFMGDPAQIPPVNRTDSIPLIAEEREKWRIEHVVLEKNMRQTDDNTILPVAYQIRNRRFENQDPLLSRISNANVKFYSSLHMEDKREFVRKMLEYFLSGEFKEDANFCKAIAWRNKTVNNLNTMVRTAFYKGKRLQKIMPEERLIADKPIFDRNGEAMIFTTSEEFVVKEVIETTLEYKLPDKGSELLEQYEMDIPGTEVTGTKLNTNIYTFKLYKCLTDIGKNIEVLHEDSEKTFWFMMRKLKARKNWDEYTKMIERFAQVKYNYAITAHKAQGSTYGTVFLIEDDIDTNPKTLERNRIKYTACTRPKDNLFILSKHNLRKALQETAVSNA